MFKKRVVVMMVALVLFVVPFSASATCQSECAEFADGLAADVAIATCETICCGDNMCLQQCFYYFYPSLYNDFYDQCMYECQ